MVNYEKYIKSKEWRDRSSNFIKSVGCCEKCSSIKKLGCHHITYYNLGNETIKDIKVWCWLCHKDHHLRLGDSKAANDLIEHSKQLKYRDRITFKGIRNNKSKGLSKNEANNIKSIILSGTNNQLKNSIYGFGKKKGLKYVPTKRKCKK